MNKKKILVCEDDQSILDILHLMLEHSGFTTALSGTCTGIAALVAEEKPDLVILDLWMPITTGDVALRQLREQPATQDLPVIVISASRNGAQIAQAAGATAFVAKPFDMGQLLETVRKYAT